MVNKKANIQSIKKMVLSLFMQILEMTNYMVSILNSLKTVICVYKLNIAMENLYTIIMWFQIKMDFAVR